MYYIEISLTGKITSSEQWEIACWLILVFFPFSAQFHPDPAVSEIVGCIRKPQEYVNGYDIIIAMQKWWLEGGFFIHQSDGNNFRPIACLKIMELFHVIDVEGAREVYKKEHLSIYNDWVG